MGSPMAGFRHVWGLSVRFPWLTLIQTSLGETAPIPVLLARPHRASIDRFPHSRLSVRVSTQRQVPLTGCCSGWPGRHRPNTRRCRIEHRPIGSPMAGFRHVWGLSVRFPWLILIQTSLGEIVRHQFSWFSRIERRPMGTPMVDSRWELAPSVRFPWLIIYLKEINIISI